MGTKNIRIRFYVGQMGAMGNGGLVSESLSELANSSSTPSIDFGDFYYQIKNLIRFNNGKSYQGIFAKLRKNDIPHIGSTDGQEREIDINEDEGVLEKNHFLYFKNHELLIYQSNHHGGTVEAFGRYFSSILNCATVFHPVLRADSIERLLSPDIEPTRIELKVAKPTNPNLYPPDNWSDHMFSLLNEIGGSTISLTISSGGRGASRQKLVPRAKQFLRKMVASGNAEVAKITAAGVEHPIDLLADRIMVTRSVEMNGRYPAEDRMYQALLEAKDISKPDLDAYFGQIDASD